MHFAVDFYALLKYNTFARIIKERDNVGGNERSFPGVDGEMRINPSLSMSAYQRMGTLAKPKEMKIRLFGVLRESIVDGPGIRYVIFVQGCPHHCKGCHNPESHDPNGGFFSSTTRIWESMMKNPAIRGVTFSGGEPFCQPEPLAEIGRCAREHGLDVMTYSGYTYGKLLEMAERDRGARDLLSVSNYLVDGPYVEAERDLSLRFRGSRNQNIYDVTCYPNSRLAKKIEL